MFKKSFDWLDKTLGRDGERWRVLLEVAPFFLLGLQLFLFAAFAKLKFTLAILALLNTPLAFMAGCTYIFRFFAKRKYKVKIIWISQDIIAPFIITGFYIAEIVALIQQLI